MTESALIATDILLDDLRHLCALPGSAEQDEELAAVAMRVAALMRQHGLQPTIVSTAGAPVVIGRRAGRSPFTLLLYHHYDVAPPGPWRAWYHDPFQLAEREGSVYGRGVAAGKGPLLAHLAAISGMIAAEGDLPCGVVVVAEGESLVGSPNISTVVSEHQALLRADACLASGGERDPASMPICYHGTKGLVQMRLTAVGANQALAPGLAASVVNPLWRLIWAISQIKSDQEEIMVNGFYDDVVSPSRSENHSIRAVQIDEAGRLSAWGLGQFLFAMSGATLVSAEATLPTCNVSSLVVEPVNDVTAIPMLATARLDFQLVPRQRPQTVVDQVREHLKSRGSEDITVERLPGGYPPTHTPFDHPFVQRVCEAGRQVFGAPLARLPLSATTAPLFFITEALSIPGAVVGCARPDSAVYGPNEHIPLADLLRHGQLLIELLYSCAAAP